MHAAALTRKSGLNFERQCLCVSVGGIKLNMADEMNVIVQYEVPGRLHALYSGRMKTACEKSRPFCINDDGKCSLHRQQTNS